MIDVLRKPLVPLLLAGALMALGGCSGERSEATAPNYNSEAPAAPSGNAATAPSGSYGSRSCTVGPTAGNNAGCDAQQDQSLIRH